MFLLNSCLGRFSAAGCSPAPLIPKLRGHFAEFLNNTSPVGLRILSSSTCVGLRYGLIVHYSGFSRHRILQLHYFIFAPLNALALLCGFSYTAAAALGPVSSFPALQCPMCPHISDTIRCWNLHQLSIGYAFRPRLRSRLTQGRSALPWKP